MKDTTENKIDHVEKSDADASGPKDFIRAAVEEDLRTGRFDGRVHTRFPPEPNGYLHIGHAKAICIDYGIAEDYQGKYNLRFDDTNPAKEEVEYAESMIEDIRWLGFDVGEHNIFYASDYFEQIYKWAEELIQKGVAYVDDLSPEEIREYRGTLTSPGKNSPYRERSIEENLDLFRRMRDGEYPEGARVLRAKIDMAAPNINLRDPVMYRILHREHYRTGDTWNIYPMYDWAHGLEDSLEGVTHSLCDLAYEAHRPLYDWFLDQLDIYHPQQLEFARLNITYTMLSKRYLLQLIQQGHVRSWEDPRLPTLAGMRRRGYPAASIRDFCDRIGIAKSNSTVDIALLEHCVRNNLNDNAARTMGVLAPLKVVIDNYPADKVEMLEVENHPKDPSMGTRQVPFSHEIYIERSDFMEDAPRKYYRLSVGREVRLKGAYLATCTSFVKDDAGEITEIHCTYDPNTRGGEAPDGRKVRGTIHWVSVAHACDAEVRIYEHLFSKEDPYDVAEGGSFIDNFNPDSLKVLTNCKVEPNLSGSASGALFQFMRQGYFCVDPDSTPERLIFNRTVNLKDTWARMQQQKKKKKS